MKDAAFPVFKITATLIIYFIPALINHNSKIKKDILIILIIMRVKI